MQKQNNHINTTSEYILLLIFIVAYSIYRATILYNFRKDKKITHQRVFSKIIPKIYLYNLIYNLTLNSYKLDDGLTADSELWHAY